MLLLAEDNLTNFSLILNKFHHFLTDRLLKDLVTMVATTPKSSEALTVLMRSHAMRGLFYEKVSNPGIIKIKDSFETFF